MKKIVNEKGKILPRRATGACANIKEKLHSCKKSKTYCYITLHTRLILEMLKELEF